MKKMSKFVLIFICIFMLTGCLKYNVKMNINADKSMDLNVKMAIDASALSGMGGEDIGSGDIFENAIPKEEDNNADENMDISDSFTMNDNVITGESDMTSELIDEMQIEKLKKLGFTVEEYKDGNYEGYSISKRISSIDEVTSPTKLNKVDLNMLLGDEENEPLKYYFYKNRNNYVADFVYDLTSDSSTTGGMDMSMYANMFDMSYSITLPTANISNNATEVSEDGKTLTWKFKYNELNSIKFEFAFAEEAGLLGIIKDNILYVGFGALFLIIVVVLVIVYINKNKKVPVEDLGMEMNTNIEPNNNLVQPVVTETPAPMVTPTQEVPVQPVVTETPAPMVTPAQEVPVQPVVTEAPAPMVTPTQEVPVQPVVTETPTPMVTPTQEVPVQPVVTEAPAPMVTPTQEVPVQPVVTETPAPMVTPTQEVPVQPVVTETPAPMVTPTQEVPVQPVVTETPAPVVESALFEPTLKPINSTDETNQTNNQ